MELVIFFLMSYPLLTLCEIIYELVLALGTFLLGKHCCGKPDSLRGFRCSDIIWEVWKLCVGALYVL